MRRKTITHCKACDDQKFHTVSVVATDIGLGIESQVDAYISFQMTCQQCGLESRAESVRTVKFTEFNLPPSTLHHN